MPETPNHGYNVPNLGDYDPAAGAKFLATAAGVVSVGEGEYEFTDTVRGIRAGHEDERTVREPTSDGHRHETPADD